MKKTIITAIFLFGSIGFYAQPSQGNPGEAPTPIDGGLSLLLAAGAALGGKKAYDAYRQKEDVE